MNFKKIINIIIEFNLFSRKFGIFIFFIYGNLILFGINKFFLLYPSLAKHFNFELTLITTIFILYILTSLTLFQIENHRQKYKKSFSDKFSKKVENKEINNKENSQDSVNEIFMNAINEGRKDDPLVGAKIGAKELFHRLINGWKSFDSKGVHVESILCILGSLAGYSCQASLRKELIEAGGVDEKQVFIIIETRDGKKYYNGDLLNKPLVESQYSIWSLAAGAVQHLGIKELIDINEIFKYTAGTVGSQNFGIPRIPEQHKPSDIPYNYIKSLWTTFLPILEQYCYNPKEWPILFGLAIQEAIFFGKDVVDPLFALSIVMESAVPMSKIDINFTKEAD